MARNNIILQLTNYRPVTDEFAYIMTMFNMNMKGIDKFLKRVDEVVLGDFSPAKEVEEARVREYEMIKRFNTVILNGGEEFDFIVHAGNFEDKMQSRFALIEDAGPEIMFFKGIDNDEIDSYYDTLKNIQIKFKESGEMIKCDDNLVREMVRK